MVAVRCVRCGRLSGSSEDSREYISLRRDVNQLIGFMLEYIRYVGADIQVCPNSADEHIDSPHPEAQRELPYLSGETPIQC